MRMNWTSSTPFFEVVCSLRPRFSRIGNDGLPLLPMNIQLLLDRVEPKLSYGCIGTDLPGQDLSKCFQDSLVCVECEVEAGCDIKIARKVEKVEPEDHF